MDDLATGAAEFLLSHRHDLQNGELHLDWERAFSGRTFSLPLSAQPLAQGDSMMDDGGPAATMAAWGRGDYSSYQDEIDGISLDGGTFTAHLGADLRARPDLLTGLALAINRSEFDFTQDGASNGIYTVNIATVNPYVSWSASDAFKLWGAFGYGRGQTKVDIEGGGEDDKESGSFKSILGGARYELTADGPVSLAVKLDGAASQFLDVDVQQGRLALEASKMIAMESGLLSTAMELGLKMSNVHESGFEVAGRLGYSQPESGLSVSANSRLLLAGGDRKEWGLGGGLYYQSQTGEGLQLALEPSVGITSSKLDTLWSLPGSEFAVNTAEPEARLKASLGYGVPLDSGLFTPYTSLSASRHSTSYDAGLYYTLISGSKLHLRAEKKFSSTAGPDHRVSLQAQVDL